MNNNDKQFEVFEDLQTKLKFNNFNNLFDIDSDLDSD